MASGTPPPRTQYGPLPDFMAHRVAKLARQYLRRYDGHSDDFDKGGERNVLRRLSPFPLRTVFDVGANVGRWSAMARSFFPQAEIHAFEISPQTFATLSENLAGPGWRLNDFGLAEKEGTLSWKDYGANFGGNTINTALEISDARIAPTVKTAEVKTGDAYCRAAGIETVDFLKIDVEGAEGRVLEGFAGMLGKGRIKVVQFEYGYGSGDAKFLMKDFFRLLEPLGFRIAKVRRGPLEWLDFHYRLNDFESGPNYLAVPGSEPEMLAALSR